MPDLFQALTQSMQNGATNVNGYWAQVKGITHRSKSEPLALGLATFQTSSRMKNALTIGHQ